VIFQVRPGPIYRSTKPVRDPNYTRYVKQFPCVGCRRTWGIDPCHCGPHGLSQKASDLTVIPLCRACHRLFDADPKTFTEWDALKDIHLTSRDPIAKFRTLETLSSRIVKALEQAKAEVPK
jgi:hypothetical protein